MAKNRDLGLSENISSSYFKFIFANWFIISLAFWSCSYLCICVSWELYPQRR